MTIRLADRVTEFRIPIPRRLSSNPLFNALLNGRDLAGGDLRRSIGPKETALEFRRTRWREVDLSASELRGFRLFDATIERCRFDKADCRDWCLWGSHVRDTSFSGADLRRAVLGGVEAGRRNRYERVDFSGADLRSSVHVSADFDHCDFSGARLDGVDFQGSVFTHCRFAGEVSDVQFHRHASRGEQYPPNEMTEVDFSAARFSFVEFRGLDLHTLRWPDGKDHLHVHDFARTLERMIGVLRERNDEAARSIVGLLISNRRWAGPQQRTGVLSKADVAECAITELWSLLERLAKGTVR